MKQEHTVKDNKNISELIEVTGKASFFEKIKIAYCAVKYIFHQLSDKDEYEKLYKLSELRGENISITALSVFKLGFNFIPKNLDRLDFAIGEDDIVSKVERTSNDTFKIFTNKGLIFHDREGSLKYIKMYWLMRDKIKRLYTYDTFFSASAVNRSFIHGTKRFPGDIYTPKEGGVIIEAGAYIGYKAISYAQQVGPTGKVIVIEASPDNYKLLKQNINENNLDEIATTINCAIWNKDGQLPMMSKTRMKHTFVDMDEIPFEPNDSIVAKSLDTIIDESNLTNIDFLNLQLNGSEIEAIEGLQKNFHKVRYINIVTRFHRDGILVVDKARKMLEERGCEIVVDIRTERLYNLTARVNS